MAHYRLLGQQDRIGWYLMSAQGPIEALRIAWMLWRYPDRVAVLIGANDEVLTLLRKT